MTVKVLITVWTALCGGWLYFAYADPVPASASVMLITTMIIVSTWALVTVPLALIGLLFRRKGA